MSSYVLFILMDVYDTSDIWHCECFRSFSRCLPLLPAENISKVSDSLSSDIIKLMFATWCTWFQWKRWISGCHKLMDFSNFVNRLWSFTYVKLWIKIGWYHVVSNMAVVTLTYLYSSFITVIYWMFYILPLKTGKSVTLRSMVEQQ